jgi:Arc/MetJ-type ribon-helix-helix transcriptional regulator
MSMMVAALRELERHEAKDALKMERLRRLLEEGEASGIAEDFSLDGILAELKANSQRADR